MRDVLQSMFGQAVDLVGGFLPSLLSALAILVVGWLFALVFSAIVRAALKRTTFDNRIATWVTDGKPVAIERYVGSVVFWMVMLFVAMAVLQALRLPAVAAPVSALLNQLATFAPRIGGAAVLLLVAWGVARIMKTLVSRGVQMARIDERLKTAQADGAQVASIGDSLGEAVYWLVFLLFLPAVLSTLALQGLLGPVQSMVTRLLDFLPNLFGATLVLAVGWFVANLVRRIVASLLAAAGADGLTDRLGLRQVLGKTTPSALVGVVVYALILLPVFVAALDALAIDALTTPASNMLSSLMQAIPALFGATVLLVIAYAVGRAVSHLVSQVLSASGFDNLLTKAGVGAGAARRPSDWAGTFAFVGLMLVAAIEASRMLGFAVLADLTAGFMVLTGHILLGLVVFGVGVFLASLAGQAIRGSAVEQAPLLSLVARVAILVLAGAMALRQMGLANEIVTLAFGLLVGAIAVAAALAFGLGARESAARIVDRWAQRLKV